MIAPGLIRRNTFVLAASMALSIAGLQLAGVVVPIVGETFLGTELAGLPLAVIIVASGVAAVPMGRFMDRRGRVPGISLGFAVGALGAVLLYVSVSQESLPLLFVGLAAFGVSQGAVALSRVGAADMYPSKRRATGIGIVLGGAAAGALGGLILFSTLLRGQLADSYSLSWPWLVTAGMLLLGAAFIWLIRVDPMEIARRLRQAEGGPASGTPAVAPGQARGGLTAGLGIIFSSPSLRTAFVAAVAAQLVMVASMPMMGLELHHRGHALSDISLAFGSHVFGMYALSPVVGRFIDSIGRVRALVIGLVVLALAVPVITSPVLAAVAAAMFAVGVGWNMAFVAATAMVADGTQPHERGLVQGSVDLTAISTAGLAAFLAPFVLGTLGLTPLVIAASFLAIAPALFIALMPRALPATAA